MLTFTVPDSWVFLGRFHPVTLHFPIGFLVLVFLLEIYAFVRPSQELRRIVQGILILGALGAVSVAAFGFILAQEGGYDPTTLTWHQYLGLAVAVLAVVSAVMHHRGFRDGATAFHRWRYRGVLSVAVVCLMAAGHQGGNLTHGSQYLVEHAPPALKRLLGEGGDSEESPAIAESEVAKAFHETVGGVFEKYCYQCHGAEKQKGGYRMDDPEWAKLGGDSGEIAIVPGAPFESYLVKVMLLSEDHDEVMPPAGKARPTPEELLQVVHWIERGAVFPEGQEAAKAPAQEQAAEVAVPTPAPASTSQAPAVTTLPSTIDFVEHIQPIFEAKCVRCHGEEKDKGDFQLHTRALAFAGGGEWGPGIVANSLEDSSIYVQISIPPDDDPDELLMPPVSKGGPLSDLEIALVRQWILEGASWPEGVVLKEAPQEG